MQQNSQRPTKPAHTKDAGAKKPVADTSPSVAAKVSHAKAEAIQKRARRPHKSRAKKYLPWEQFELTTNGFYAHHLRVMTEQLPMLTPMELRVAALVSGLLPSREIARILHVHEHAIEKHRSNIRKKFGLPGKLPLTTFLQAVMKRAAGRP